MDKFEELFKVYNCNLNDETVKKEVDAIISKHLDENNNKEVYKQCLSLIDLTSLNGNDTEAGIVAMTEKVNDFRKQFSTLPNVAAICVYPAMVPHVKENLTEDVRIAAVAGGFPASQTFIEVKVAEAAMTALEGADEIDAVISVGKFLEGKYDEVYEEISEIKASCRGAQLKVILETGDLKTAANIKKAALIAMAAGADFIKTSTGKTTVSATLEATYVMCQAIKEWNDKNNAKVGYKAAGGIATTDDAVKYYTLVKEILGKEWLNNSLFRFGASRLTNSLLSSIEGKEINYF
ncbi:deoxyribose-phosphate aldolase [Paludibacter sp. 221]|uniref:deoxyribose-phosphate aldolase n=1 Tax=Paludibacter sp. 221 TaxID=2302939 RepID=UPI0013D34C46|nr:deoxyribose-phosphate aldolase [Paludibacter sp. 221]NDV46762.1 deoxyribose-phosphate aldolase [Paludibacter sp. 221]